MRFDLKVALRYLLSNRLQSALLIGGVAIAVTVFTFNAALINGLAEFQIDRVVGSSAHVVIEPAKPAPRIVTAPAGTERLVVSQRALERREHRLERRQHAEGRQHHGRRVEQVRKVVRPRADRQRVECGRTQCGGHQPQQRVRFRFG